MKKIVVLVGFAAAIFGAKKLLSGKEADAAARTYRAEDDVSQRAA